MAETQDADVEQVMERIRENIRRRRSLAPSDPLASPVDGQEPAGNARLRSIGDLGALSLESHRRLFGPIVIAVKKALFKLLTPMVERQTAYNAASAQATADLEHALRSLERRHAQELRTVTERLERSQRQAVVELRAYLGEEAARVKTDLSARDSQRSQDTSTLRQDTAELRQEMTELRHETAELRQAMAAQVRAIESAGATLVTLRSRASESERRWRRVVHALHPDPALGGPPAAAAPRPASTELEPELDHAGFEERFRGSDEAIKNRQRIYVPDFAGARTVLDLGCGRGEFLELLREHGIPARGVDHDLDMVLLCRDKKLDVVRDDALTHLGALADDTLGGIFAARLIERLSPRRVVDLVKLCHRKLAPGGVLVLETPNPGCLTVFAGSTRDLSSIHLIHPDTLTFIFEAAGLGEVEARFSAPVDPDERLPHLRAPGVDFERFNQGLDRVNALLFGSRDYAAIGRKLA